MVSCTYVTRHARLRLRQLQAWVSSVYRPSRDSLNIVVMIPNSLTWWLDHRTVCAGVPFHAPQPFLHLVMDASSLGWGAHLWEHHTQGLWTASQLALHINVRDLMAVRLAYQAFLGLLHSRCVLVLTDNTTAMFYINKQGGARASPLCQEAIRLWEFCIAHSIHLMASFLPGVQNSLADRLSRSFQTHDWSIRPDIIYSIFQRWGFPQVDLFASRANRKCHVFCSLQGRSPGSLSDAFLLTWKDQLQASPQSATTPRMESAKGTTIATSSRTPPSLSLQGPLSPPVCPPAPLDELSPDSIDAHTFDFETIAHPNLEQALKQGSLDLDSLAESPESDFMSAVNEFVIEENPSSPNIVSDPQSPEMMVESLYSSVINAIDNRRMQDTNICVKEDSLNARMEKCRVVAQESQFNLKNIKEDLCHFRTFVQKEQCDFSNSLKCTSVEIRNIIQTVKLSLEKALKDKHQKELQSLKSEYETRIDTLLEDVEENKKKIKKLTGDLIGLEEVLQNKDNEFAMVKNEKEAVVCLQNEKDQKLLALEGQMKDQNCEIKELRLSREMVLEDLKKFHIENDEKIQLLRAELQSLEQSHLKELENNLQIKHTQEFEKLIVEHKDCLDKLKKENQQRFEQMQESHAAVVQEKEQQIEKLKLKISDLFDVRCKLEVELAMKEADTDEMKILLEESRTQQQEILKSLIDKETEHLRKELDNLNHKIQVNNDEYQVGLVELRTLMTIEKDLCISELVDRHEEETNVLKIELNRVTSLHQKAFEVEKSLKEQIIELQSKLEVEANALEKQKEEKLAVCEQKDKFEAVIHNLEEEKELLITNQEQERKLLVQRLSSEKEDAIRITLKESELQREAVEKELLEKIQLLEMQVNQSPSIELSAASSLVIELQEKLEEEKIKFLEQLEEQEKRKNEEMQNFRMSLTAEQQTNFNTVLTREKMKKENIINDLSDKLKTITQQQERDKDLIETLSEDRARLLEEKKKLEEEVNKMRSSNFIPSAYLPTASESCEACAPDLPAETERVASEITDEGRLDSAMETSMMMSQSMSSVSSRHSEKIAIRDFQVGDLVLIILDERHDNYVLFTVSPTLYFLHSESLAALDLKPGECASGASRRPWVLGKVMEKEYCQAKKAQNRFKVPLGTKFYRVKAVPWNKKV
uniref:RB1 inducible coiled-coil 1 n=1 Tax=Chrysemys picta bellii TaxID=8478 RepID=A0A8C3H6Y3_CHRPI